MQDVKQFYYYSATSRRTVLQQQKNNKPAYKLAVVEDLESLRDERGKENIRFVVTTSFGLAKEKLQSRLLHCWTALSWHEHIQDENKNKTVTLWQVIAIDGES